MTTQAFYTPSQAAGVLGCKEQDVLNHIKNGALKASFMSNIANYVISYNDLMTFIKATKDFKSIQKMVSRRIVVVDRDPKVQDIMKMELGRQGFDIKIATTEREVAFLVDEIKPDVIVVHAGATTREKEPVKNSLERARTHCKTFIVLYHNYAASVANSPEFQEKMKAINPDQIVVLERGITPLVDAVRARYGLKTTVVTRRPQA
jgi:PleD family two-component response regulator